MAWGRSGVEGGGKARRGGGEGEVGANIKGGRGEGAMGGVAPLMKGWSHAWAG